MKKQKENTTMTSEYLLSCHQLVLKNNCIITLDKEIHFWELTLQIHSVEEIKTYVQMYLQHSFLQ